MILIVSFILSKFLVVDLSLKTNIVFNVPLKLSINPEQYNLLRQCLDLNIMFSDGMQDVYKFERKLSQKRTEGLMLCSNVDIITANIILTDFESDLLVELQAELVSVKTKLFWGNHSQTIVTAEKICAYDRNHEKNRTKFLSPKENLVQNRKNLGIF